PKPGFSWIEASSSGERRCSRSLTVKAVDVVVVVMGRSVVVPRDTRDPAWLPCRYAAPHRLRSVTGVRPRTLAAVYPAADRAARGRRRRGRGPLAGRMLTTDLGVPPRDVDRLTGGAARPAPGHARAD